MLCLRLHLLKTVKIVNAWCNPWGSSDVNCKSLDCLMTANAEIFFSMQFEQSSAGNELVGL